MSCEVFRVGVFHGVQQLAGRGVQDIHEVQVRDKLLHEYEAQGRSTISGKSVAKGGVGQVGLLLQVESDGSVLKSLNHNLFINLFYEVDAGRDYVFDEMPTAPATSSAQSQVTTDHRNDKHQH